MTLDTLSTFVNNGAFWLITGLLAYGAKTLNKLGESVTELNRNIALVIAQTAAHSKMIEDHESRIRSVEREA